MSAAKTGDKKKEVQKKLMGECGHVIIPIRVWRKMKRYCETCKTYAKQVKQ